MRKGVYYRQSDLKMVLKDATMGVEGVGGTEEMKVDWSPPIHTTSCGGVVSSCRCECEVARIHNGDLASHYICC